MRDKKFGKIKKNHHGDSIVKRKVDDVYKKMKKLEQNCVFDIGEAQKTILIIFIFLPHWYSEVHYWDCYSKLEST